MSPASPADTASYSAKIPVLQHIYSTADKFVPKCRRRQAASMISNFFTASCRLIDDDDDF
jgi:hypothetical protein